MEPSFDKGEVDKLFSIMKQATLETDEKFANIEARIGDQARDVVETLERVRNEMAGGLQ